MEIVFHHLKMEKKVYTLDARTIYGSLGYSIYDFEFGALYGITRYDNAQIQD